MAVIVIVVVGERFIHDVEDVFTSNGVYFNVGLYQTGLFCH